MSQTVHLTDGRLYVEPIYLLRWRMDYASRPSVYSGWASDVEEASRQPRDGLVRVSIEGMERGANRVFRLAECSGDKFVQIGWMRVTRTPLNLAEIRRKTGCGDVKLTGQIHGIVLTADDETMTVLIDGSAKVEEAGRPPVWMNLKDRGQPWHAST